MHKTGSRPTFGTGPLILKVLLLAFAAAVFFGVQALVQQDDARAGVLKVTVNTTANDDDDGSGCDHPFVDASTDCSLREAIQAANVNDADLINFDFNGASSGGGSGTIDLTSGDGVLPAVTSDDVVIDATGAAVILDGGGTVSPGLLVEPPGNGHDFTLQSGSGSFRVRNIDGDAIRICGRTVECGGSADVSVGDITVDDIDVGPNVSDGVEVRANDLINVNITDNRIDANGDAVILHAQGDASDVLGNSTAHVNGNTIDGGDEAVDIEFCTSATCDLSSTILMDVSNNGNITGGDDGVDMELFVDGAAALSSVSLVVDDNGNITADDDAIDADIQLNDTFIIDGDDNTNADLSATISVSGNGNITAATTSADEAIDINQIEICCGTSDNTNTVTIDGNGAISTASDSGANAIDVDSDAGFGDGNSSTVAVTNNGNISSADGRGIEIDSRAGGEFESADDTANNNTSTVRVNGNGNITSDDQAVDLFSEAEGTDCCSNPGTANFNSSTVEVNGNGQISSAEDQGIEIDSEAGNDNCCPGGQFANNNTSNVTVDGNGDITGASAVDSFDDDGIDIDSRAGMIGGDSGSTADFNTATATITDNGDITGHGDSGDNGIDLNDTVRAGMGGCGGGDADNNTAEVTITGNGDIRSLAGNLQAGGEGIDGFVEAGVCIDGGSGDDGDENSASAQISDNASISGASDDGVILSVRSGGGTADSADNSTSVVIGDPDLGDTTDEGNGNISGVDDNAIQVFSLTCCDAANTNFVGISGNNGTITNTGDGADAINLELSTTVNTIEIIDNEGVISSGVGGSDGIDINTEDETGTSTDLTISGNDISNSAAGGGIDICCGDYDGGADGGADRSIITDNTINDNFDAGIALFGDTYGLQIGPANEISSNGTDTGIHIDGSGSDQNTITQNSIFDNDDLGIELNDPFGVGCTNVSGPNQCLAEPDIAGFVNGKISGTACANCRVEIFEADDTPGDQADINGDQHGEGARFQVAGNATSLGTFSINLPCGQPIKLITATATDSAGNTSEFSENFGPVPATSTCAPTATATATRTNTPTGPTNTPVNTSTPGGATATATRTPTRTPTPTVTPTGTLPTAVPTAAATATNTAAPPTNTSVPPAATATATRTRTPTVVPTKDCGDVNDDGSVNSVDSALILQLEADLINSLINPGSADVNDSGEINSIDSSLILQKEAALILQSGLNCGSAAGAGLNLEAIIDRVLPW